VRVIAGTKRRINLETPAGDNTRPTTDRIKETLYNMIGPDLYDCNFLDLFAGSGQMGIEALSRGASHATFVEKNPKALECINKNLSKTDLKSVSKVISSDVFVALKGLHEHFDFIFMDPPYDNLLEKQILEALSTSEIIDEDSIIIVEASLNTDFSYTSDLGFDIIKEKRYKTNKHMFIQRTN